MQKLATVVRHQSLRLASVVFTLLLIACARQGIHPSPYFTQDVIVIPPYTLYSYWRSSNPLADLPVEAGSGCISIELTIDSNGKVYNPKLVAVSGPKDLSTKVLNYLSGQKFKPAPGNAERIPVQTIYAMSYTEGGLADPKAMEPCTTQQADTTKR